MLKLAGTIGAESYCRELPPGRYIAGRTADCDLFIDNKTVSRRHAKILVLPGDDCLYLSDLESSNGTWVNGIRIQVRTKVLPGDRISFGQVELTVIGTDAEETTLPDPTDHTP
ncbi:MAG: FHA domain-containing protein [Candidatus Zixiibacteriota bacterium]|nr:MAG: FHA domain-containing protein [candidate division Zixibacteria bacterium]